MIHNGEECYGVIYKITHRDSGKCYIGQTINWHNRLGAYRRGLAAGQTKLNRAFIKYGIEAFDFGVIYTAYDRPQLDYLETWFIEEEHAISNGYNCMSGGANSKPYAHTIKKRQLSLIGRVVSQETRDKLSRANKGRKPAPHTLEKARIAAIGRKRSPEAVEKTRQANLGRRWSPEARALMLITRKGQGKGRKLAPEVVEQLRQRGLGRKMSPESIEKSRRAKIGRKRPDVTGAKNPSARAVLCVTTGQCYGCIADAVAATGASVDRIGACCRGRYAWTGRYTDGTKLIWRYADKLPPVQLPEEAPAIRQGTPGE